MRFLINEKPYERPIAAGSLRYIEDGAATGTQEHWRMTRTTRDDLIVRVDLDARDNGGSSYLYHYIEDSNGVMQRLVYRAFGDGMRVSGSILLEDGHFIDSRVVDGETVEDAISADHLLFPSTTGLAVLARHITQATVAILDIFADEIKLHSVAMNCTRADDAELTIGRKLIQAQTNILNWQDQTRTVQHHDGFPLTVNRHDGLTATSAQFIFY